MSHPNFVILYVNSPAESAAFYSRLLDLQPVEQSPTFAMFVLESGMKLGLWSRHTVEPAAAGAPGHGELVFARPDAAGVEACFESWKAQGLRILQTPCDMDFGHTFTALDPDGHRLRVYTPF